MSCFTVPRVDLSNPDTASRWLARKLVPQFGKSSKTPVTDSPLAIQNGWSSEKFGRRRGIILACVFAILGAALQAGARDPAYFFSGCARAYLSLVKVLIIAHHSRLLTGVGIGALSVGVPLYNTGTLAILLSASVQPHQCRRNITQLHSRGVGKPIPTLYRGRHLRCILDVSCTLPSSIASVPTNTTTILFSEFGCN